MPPSDLLENGPIVNPAEDQGVEFPWEQASAISVDLTGVAFDYFVNRTPIVSRAAQFPATQQTYNMFGHANRPNQVKVMASITNVATTINVSDASVFMNGDILELPTGEHVEVSADPDLVGNNLTVVRGVESTTATAITVVGGSEPTAWLIANSRTGGERWQHGIFPKTWTALNWIQTAQHPVEISGVFQDTTGWQNAVASPDPLDFGRQTQLENMMVGYERAFIYGIGESPTSAPSKRGKTKGIMKRLAEVGNVTNAPEGFAGYTPDRMMRDLWGNINGNQNLLMLSPNFRYGLALWKIKKTPIDMGTTVFDMRIESFVVPEFGPMLVIFNPCLRPGTAMALREQDIIVRYMRRPTWYARGKPGDTWEGDIIARMGIQTNNPELQTAVTGITGFAAP